MTAETRFTAFPACCRTVLEALFHEHKTGARNCAHGHSVSLERAAAVEAQRRAEPKPRQGT